MNNVHFKSSSCEWETPQDLFDEIDREFHFNLDVCALPDNAKCKEYFSPLQDGLLQNWSGVCWMNPPYGRQIKEWMKKAFKSAGKGATIVCLVPSRTDSIWWHKYAMNGEIRFIKGRIKFGGAKDSAPFPSAIVIFRPKLKYEMGLYHQRGIF